MKELLKSLANAKSEIGKMSKDSNNPFFKSKYFDINQLLEHVEPLLLKHKLLVLQPIEEGRVITKIYHVESGDFVSSELDLPQIADPQKVGSAITYYRRYTLASLLAIQAEDDDGNKASGNGGAWKEYKKADDLKWLNKGTPEWESILRGVASKKIQSLADARKYYKINNTTADELSAIISNS